MLIHSQRLKSFTRALRLKAYPRPFEHYNDLRGLSGAEVGVLGGEHALSLLRSGAAGLYLIDPYVPYVDFDAKAMAKAKAQARSRLRRLSVCFCYEPSSLAAQLLPKVSFVYIDARHDLASVRADLQAWWPKVLPGGLLGGHDFDNGGCSDHDGVVQAVTDFVTEHRLKLCVESPDWWVRKP